MNIPSEWMSRLLINFPFKWTTQSISYLGIHLPQHLNQGYSLNSPQPYKNKEEDIKKLVAGYFFIDREMQYYKTECSSQATL